MPRQRASVPLETVWSQKPNQTPFKERLQCIKQGALEQLISWKKKRRRKEDKFNLEVNQFQSLSCMRRWIKCKCRVLNADEKFQMQSRLP